MKWPRLIGQAPGAAVAEVALAVIACAAGALVYAGFFSTTDCRLPLGLACLVGGVTAALGHRRAWTAALAAVAGLTLVLVFGVFDGAASAVLDGVRGSWNRLLTAAVPVDPWAELLVVPAVVMWATAFSAVLLTLRTRHVLAPLAPPLAGFLFAVLVVGNQAGGHAPATVVFLVAALALIAIRTHSSASSSAVRVERQSPRPLVALAVVALMVAAAALFGVVGGQVPLLASGAHRFDVRDLLAPPVTGSDTLTPLAQLKRQLNEDPPRTLFTVRLEGEFSAEVDRVRTAALDAFDGTTWTSTGTYRVAGSRLTVDPELVHGKPLTAHVELKEFSGPYLPVVGWPSRLAAPGETRGQFGFDPDSGVVVSTGPAPRELRYDVTGEVRRRDEGLSRVATAAYDSPQLPAGLPERLRALAEQFRSNPYDRLVSLESYLRSARYRLDRPPGHSYAAISRLLEEGMTGGGYAEQTASAFTVLARFWGFPARVAVGYRLDAVQGGVFHVTTANAHAWSEVHFAGYGWVAFDPSRTDVTLPNPQPEAPRVVPPRPAPPSTAPPATPPADAAKAAARPAEAAGERGLGWNKVLHGTAALVPAAVVLMMLTGGAVVIVKAVRRRLRRRVPDHADQVLGAWREQLDRLIERGISPPVSLTFHEVARHVRARLGDAAEPVETTAELATTAIYASEHVDRADAEHAWELVARLNTELYPRRLSAARLRATLDPRPLWTARRAAWRRRQAGEDLEMGRYR
jgi:transglutaminase-like putative cysteine protease